MGIAIAFAQQKGGSGKTTLLTHLAHSWAHAGRDVGLVDLDPQRSLTNWAHLNREIHLNLQESKDWRAASDIRKSTRAHDITLVDCPGNVDVLLRTTIRACDLVIAPCQPTGLDVWATEALLKICESEGTPCKVVLNRVPARQGQRIQESFAKLEEIGADVVEARIGNRVAFSAGLLDGMTALSGKRKSTARDEIEALRMEIDKTLATL